MAAHGFNRPGSYTISFVSGCPRSLVDAGRLIDYFDRNGWRQSNLAEADLVLVGGCASTGFAETRSLAYLRAASRRASRANAIVAFGCVAPYALGARVLGLTRQRLNELDELIGARVPFGDAQDTEDLATIPTAQDTFCSRDRIAVRAATGLRFPFKELVNLLVTHDSTDSTSVLPLRVQTGCDEQCSYCTIRHSSGAPCSEPLARLLSSARRRTRAWHRSIDVIGDDIGAYGCDSGSSVVDVLGGLLRATELKVGWSDFHPKWLLRHLQALRSLFVEHRGRFTTLGFPVQSGSQAILQSMRRSYQIDEVESCLHGLRRLCPELALSTHLLVGFPGETERDFLASMEFAERVGFERIEVYAYSDRPNTEAAAMTRKVPRLVTAARILRLRARFGDRMRIY